MDAARLKTQRMDEITSHANMPNKGWVFSGTAQSSGVVIGGEDIESEKVLGLLLTVSADTFGFRVVLKFKEVNVEVVVQDVEDFERIVLNAARIFDAVGCCVQLFFLQNC